jgi:hypothetical protein
MKAPMRMSSATIITFFAIAFSQNGFAQDKATNEKVEKDYKEVEKEYKRQQADKTKESMRDKTHDNRLKVDKDTSVGVEKNGASVIKTIP